MFILRFRKSHDNLSLSDVTLSSRMLSEFWWIFNTKADWELFFPLKTSRMSLNGETSIDDKPSD